MTNAQGIDISHWQAATPTLDGLDFVWVRGSYGSTSDELYGLHAANVRKAGRLLFATMFGRPPSYDRSVKAQVAAFLDTIKAEPPDLCVAVDVEAEHIRIASGGHIDIPPMSHADATEAISRLKAAGFKSLLYHSDSGFFGAGQDGNWVARWSTTPPSRHWAFWQDGSDQIDGKGIDHDYFHGDRAALYRFAGFSDTPPDSSTGGTSVQLTPAELIYRQQLVPKIGVDLLDAPKGAVHRKAKAGDQFDYICAVDDAPGGYHVVRAPGDVILFIARGDVAQNITLPDPTDQAFAEGRDAVVAIQQRAAADGAAVKR